jgi:hypothetical protein
MAERLKTKMLEGNLVDLVAGPDAYRDLPRLLDIVHAGNQEEAGKLQATFCILLFTHIVVHTVCSPSCTSIATALK